MKSIPLPIRGRGASDNPANRFEVLSYKLEDDEEPQDPLAPKTTYLKDTSRTIIAYNDSPDISFSASINPYRGCEHGCVYCYARPTHEYLGFSSGLDFETKILVKEDAPQLLRRELNSPKWKPQTLAMSGVTDAYQPIERKLELTRKCLQVLVEFVNPVGVVTKNSLVTRDVDLFAELAKENAVAVFISITTLEEKLRQNMEPRTSTIAARLAALETLAKAGVPAGVMVAPVIPGLNDHEIPDILQAAAKAGARFAGYVTLRLPFALKELMEKWLEQHHPLSKDKVLNRIRSLRGGKLNDTTFGKRMRGDGIFAEAIEQLFKSGCRKAGIADSRLQLSNAGFRGPFPEQPTLF